ncbi:Endothelin-converting enzyme 1 [Thoreauomyces humboldtii]|nr:Endothelin-converting enzyme 1 [Thoreauomyces humboldtii]
MPRPHLLNDDHLDSFSPLQDGSELELDMFLAENPTNVSGFEPLLPSPGGPTRLPSGHFPPRSATPDNSRRWRALVGTPGHRRRLFLVLAAVGILFSFFVMGSRTGMGTGGNGAEADENAEKQTEPAVPPSVPSEDKLPDLPGEGKGPAQPGNDKAVATPCNTRECVMVASALLAKMNQTVDPCDNFFEYACGGWKAANPIPASLPSLTSFTKLGEENLLVLKKALEGPYVGKPSLSTVNDKFNRENFGKVQNLYHSCMNETQIRVNGVGALLPLLQDLYKTFPFANLEVTPPPLDGGRLAKGFSLLAARSIPLFASMGVGPDLEHPDTNVINISQEGLSMPSKEYYKDPVAVQILAGVIEEVLAVLLELIESPQDIQRRAKKVAEFETALANISLSSANRTNPRAGYNPMTVAGLQELSPFFSWSDYLEMSFPAGSIKPTTTVIIESPTYMTELSSLLSTQRPEVLEDYFVWQAGRAYANQLPFEFRALISPLAKLAGAETGVEPPRWRTCVGITDALLGEMLGRWFVEVAFGGDSKGDATKIVHAIKEAFLTRLPTIGWLDDATRAQAMKKIDALVTKIGYDDIVMDPARLAAKFSDLVIDPTNYLQNAMNVAVWNNKDNLADFGKPVDRGAWRMTPATVNAYYVPSSNEIVFPSGILQPPFFSSAWPQYLQLGAIGLIVGHELTHGFDSKGRQFDGTGKLVDWWTAPVAKKFEERAQCFRDYFARYSITTPDGTKIPVDGELTLGENIADSGGLACAHEAWTTARKKGGAGANQVLPGFGDLTPDHIFFIGYSQMWCSHYTPSVELLKIRTDPHSPSSVRIRGTLGNSPAFSETFHCPQGSPMNPVEKCALW